MGLGNRNKVSAEFSMSSLTDIIFLLLIFFMLTSNFVRVEPFDLPKSDAKTVAPATVVVSISKDGKYSLNQQEMPLSALKTAIRQELAKAENKDNSTVSIAAEVGTSFDKVVKIMDIAKDLRLRAMLATAPTNTKK